MSEPRALASAKPTEAIFYRFEDGQGRVHIVDSLSDVPLELQGKAERIAIGPRRQTASELSGSKPVLLPAGLEWQSFAVGFAVAALLGAALLGMRGRFGIFTRLAVFAAIAALLAGAYFGLLRRQTGQADSAMASPGAIVDDARSAVKKMDARNKAQERLLDDIQREAK